MWIQFYLEHIHFSINIFAAVVLFSVAWLYLDAWSVNKKLRESIRFLGFVLLSLSFLIHGLTLENTAFGNSILPLNLQTWSFTATRLGGYLCIIASLLLDPINPKPELERIRKKKRIAPLGILPASHVIFTIGAAPLLSMVCGLLYFYRARIGLERHLKTVSIALLILSISEFLNVRSIFVQTNDISLYALLKPYGPVWILEHVCLFISMTLLGRWVFGYLLKRFETQIFIFITIIIVTIFLFTGTAYTTLILSSLQNNAIKNMHIHAQLIERLFQANRNEVAALSEVVAQDQTIQTLLKTNKRRELAVLTKESLLKTSLSSLLITNTEGTLVSDAEQLDRFGMRVIDDALLTNKTEQRIQISRQGFLPTLTVAAVTPIKEDDKIIGYTLVQRAIDNAFLDNIKTSSGLDVSLYTGKILSATTLTDGLSSTRPVGTSETSQLVLKSVFDQGVSWTGITRVLNTPFLAAYTPITQQSERIGMIMIGEPADTLLASARRAIELTFIFSTLCVLFSVVPAYIISRYLTKQIH